MSARLSWPRWSVLAILLLVVPVFGVPTPGDSPKESAAEKTRRALDQVVSVEYANIPLSEAIGKLRELTKLNIVLDRGAVPNFGGGFGGGPGGGFGPPGGPQPPGGAGFGRPPGDGAGSSETTIELKLKDVKVRTVLTQLGHLTNLTYVIEQDVIVLTRTDQAFTRMLNQRVSIDFSKEPLEKALKHLATETGVNLFLDPREAKKGTEPITLKLDDVPLDAALKLMTEMAGLRHVRVANVLMVTSNESAARLGGNGFGGGAAGGFPGFPMPPGGGGGFPGGFPGIPVPPPGGAGGVAPPIPPAPGDIEAVPVQPPPVDFPLPPVPDRP